MNPSDTDPNASLKEQFQERSSTPLSNHSSQSSRHRRSQSALSSNYFVPRKSIVEKTSAALERFNTGSRKSLSSNSLGNQADEQIISKSIEDFDLKAPIGYGSSAVVYLAIHKRTGRTVAIKTIDLDLFERNQIDELRRETAVMGLCKNTNVLAVYCSFVFGSKLYLVTPYLAAGSCLDILKNSFPDGFEEVIIATILKQALLGLDYLHKTGHIHRDVKAGNMLIDEEGVVKLSDFGVSSSLMDSGGRNELRKTFVGTPCWMAPEVMEQAGYDYKADIWSFGITALELATGQAPFAKYPPIKVLMLTIQNDPPTLDRDSTKFKYSKTFKEMIDSCLQKVATKRPTAEKLLGHPFFKQAKKPAYLVTSLLEKLKPLSTRPPKAPISRPIQPTREISWDFETFEPKRTSKDDSDARGQISDFDTSIKKSRFIVDTKSSEAEQMVSETKKGRFSVMDGGGKDSSEGTPVSNKSPSNESLKRNPSASRRGRFEVSIDEVQSIDESKSKNISLIKKYSVELTQTLETILKRHETQRLDIEESSKKLRSLQDLFSDLGSLEAAVKENEILKDENTKLSKEISDLRSQLSLLKNGSKEEN